MRKHLVADKPRADGTYVLRASYAAASPPNPEGEGFASIGSESLDQADVERIEVVEPNSPLHVMRYDFAIIQDPSSRLLNQKL